MNIMVILAGIIGLICVLTNVRRKHFQAKGQVDPFRHGIYAALIALGAVMIYVAIHTRL